MIRVHVNGMDAEPSRGHVRRAVRVTLESEGIPDAEVSITALDDDAIRTLNRTYLEHDWPTDVISFPLHGAGESPLGDVYIGIARAREQADERNITLEEELVRLVVHGTLHILGFVHPADVEIDEQDAFFRKQERLVQRVMDPEQREA